MLKLLSICAIFLITLIQPLRAQEPTHDLIGDIGGAMYATSSFVQGVESKSTFLPYANFEYKSLFARIDTFGYQILPLGSGHLELVTRVNLEGYKSTNSSKNHPVPIGLGTMQLTPYGAFFLNTFIDVASSKGSMTDIMWAVELNGPRGIALYPEVGLIYKNSRYQNYFYGVSQGDITNYQANAGISPYWGVLLEVPIIDSWYTNTFFRRSNLSSGITHSPLVEKNYQNFVFLSISYRYQ
jgi:outer membrane protein